MPWLADLVESSEGSFNVLPVQCLCEFLLDSTATIAAAAASGTATSEEDAKALEVKKRKQKELLRHLQDLLQQEDSDQVVRDALKLCYFSPICVLLLLLPAALQQIHAND